MASSRSRQPDSLPERVAARLAPLLPAQGEALPLRVAFSGGLDSCVLLHVLAGLAQRLPLALQVCHVHHGLSAHADAWATHCAAYSRCLNLPFEAKHVEVPRQDSAGLEAAARKARYAALGADWTGWLALAHHADDQAETVLFRLCRGAGVTGAAAMRELDFSRRQIRPLLAETRAALEAYAHAHELSWVEDDSNPDTRFARNFLRHEVLRPLKARFPAAAENLARSAGIFAESDHLLAELAQLDAQQVGLGRAGSRERFLGLSHARARNLLRHYLSGADFMLPEMARLDDGLRQLTQAAAVRWVFGHTAVCSYRDQLWLEPAQIPAPQAVVWQGEAEIPWAGGVLQLPAALADSALPVRIGVREEGLHWRLGPGRPLRSFKLLCQDLGVPPWWRTLLPCVWQGDNLLWIGGLAASEPAGFVWRGGWPAVLQDQSA